MKKLVALLLLFSLFFASMPQTAFCDDHNESPVACHHNCSLTCHNHLNAVITSPIVFQGKFPVLVSVSTSAFSYQNPTVDGLKRPPIYLS